MRLSDFFRKQEKTAFCSGYQDIYHDSTVMEIQIVSAKTMKDIISKIDKLPIPKLVFKDNLTERDTKAISDFEDKAVDHVVRQLLELSDEELEILGIDIDDGMDLEYRAWEIAGLTYP